MKGEIFNLLESFTIERFGISVFETVWERTRPRLETQSVFIGPGTYPDQDFLRIFTTVLEVVGIGAAVAQHEFGRFCFSRLLAKLPQEMREHPSARELLKSIDEVIHVEVRKIYRDAEPPRFTYVEPDARTLVLTYRSRRGLFDLVEGLVAGCGDHYGCAIEVSRQLLPDEGNVRVCQFVLTFSSEAA